MKDLEKKLYKMLKRNLWISCLESYIPLVKKNLVRSRQNYAENQKYKIMCEERTYDNFHAGDFITEVMSNRNINLIVDMILLPESKEIIFRNLMGKKYN